MKRSIDGYHQEKQRKVQATKEVEARMFELARFKAAEVAKVGGIISTVRKVPLAAE